jgi:DNA polymerase-3 subunit gamma/tau
MTVELALLRAARPQLDPSKEALAERLERLEAAAAGAGGDAGVGTTVSDPAPGGADARDAEGASRSPRMSSPAAPPPAPVADASPPESGGEEEKPVAQAVVVEIGLEAVVGAWPAVIDRVREGGSELLSHVLAAARPVAVKADEAILEVGFPPSAAFNKRKAEAIEARDRVADAVDAIVGARLRPVYVLLEGDDDTETPAEAKLSEEELVELVRSEFDAEEYVAEPGEGEAEAKEMNG